MENPAYRMFKVARATKKIPDPIFSTVGYGVMTTAIYDSFWLVRSLAQTGLPSPAINRIFEYLVADSINVGFHKERFVVCFPCYKWQDWYRWQDSPKILQTYTYVLDNCVFCKKEKLNGEIGKSHIHNFSIDEMLKLVTKGKILWVLTLFARDFGIGKLAL